MLDSRLLRSRRNSDDGRPCFGKLPAVVTVLIYSRTISRLNVTNFDLPIMSVWDNFFAYPSCSSFGSVCSNHTGVATMTAGVIGECVRRCTRWPSICLCNGDSQVFRTARLGQQVLACDKC